MKRLSKFLLLLTLFIIIAGGGVWCYSLFREPSYEGEKIYMGEGQAQALTSVRGVVYKVTGDSIVIFVNKKDEGNFISKHIVNKDETYTVPKSEIREVIKSAASNEAEEKVELKDLSKGVVVTYLPGYGVLMVDTSTP